MGDLLETLISPDEAISRVAGELHFPWRVKSERVGLADLAGCPGRRLSGDIKSMVDSPRWARSLRDGFAVRSSDLYGASAGSPVFLKCVGEVRMGETPDIKIGPESCAGIHTGGVMPDGSDAVLMLEDSAAAAAGLVEARRALQSGENVIQAGEEFKAGETLLRAGTLLDFASVGLLASLGFGSADVFDLKIGVLSTGDEIMDPCEPGAADEPQTGREGKVMDVNSWTVSSLLSRNGYGVRRFGIVGDDRELLEDRVGEMLRTCGVVILSGGSSVSTHDYTSDVLSKLAGGIIVHGVRFSPGKPTIIAGDRSRARLAVGLPGHPLSCVAVMYALILPILSAMLTGSPSEPFRRLRLPVSRDVFGHTGIEELVPFKFDSAGRVVPLPSKSAYTAALRGSCGFIRLGENTETLRAGDEAEILMI